MSSLVIAGALASLLATGLISLHFLLILFTPLRTSPTPSEKKYTTTPTSSPLPLSSIKDDSEVELSVVIPAYNEDDRLGIMVDEAMEYLLSSSSSSSSSSSASPSDTASGSAKGKGAAGRRSKELRTKGTELIIVDDGSRDSTTLTAQKLAEKWGKVVNGTKARVEIRVITLESNRGKGGAVQHGVVHSRGRLILFADADGASRFSDLDLLLDGIDKIVDGDGHGMVVGSRAHLVNSEAVVKRSALRNLLMHGFHFFLRTLGVDGIRDTQCGFKLFTRSTARLLFPTLHLPRWSFDVELLLLASLTTPSIPVLEIPIAWHEVSGSKINLGWDSIGMARDLLVLRGNLAVGRWVVPQRQESKAGTENGHGEKSEIK